MIKYVSFFALTLLLAFPVQATSFIEGLEDVPLMNGMEQLPNDNISFGNEDSRLVETLLTSNKYGFKKTAAFYKNTLPQMGWQYQGMRGQTLVFEREGEVLELSKESDKPLTVRLTVKSKM